MALITNSLPLDAIIEVYVELDRIKTWEYFPTGAGINISSNLHFIQYGLDILSTRGVINPDMTFLDAGSGDGRVVAFAASYGPLAFGIEYYSGLVSVSENKHAELLKQSVFPKNPPACVQGNFLDISSDGPYSKLGLSFSDIDLFFNFANNHGPLAHAIATHAKPSALFLFYSALSSPQLFHPLRCIDTIYSPSTICGAPAMNLQVYRKV